MYIKNSCRIKDKIEIEKHYPGNYGAPGIKREPKKKRTPEEMAKQNYWRKVRYLRRIIELNFNPGDFHIQLTCRPDQRPTMEEGMKVIRAFRDKLRNEYKRQGWVMKYIITCETGKRGAIHWHMILNNCHNEKTSTTKLIWKHWNRGRPWFVPMDESGDYSKLAEYIVKETTKRIEEGQTLEKLSYMISRNMIKPEVIPEEVRANRWSKKPSAPKGWYVVPESIVNGRNKFTGLPYQYYTIRRIQKGEG